MQFLRMTCQTGPSGRSTFGRAAPRFCAPRGTAKRADKTAIVNTRRDQLAALTNLDFITNISIPPGWAVIDRPYSSRSGETRQATGAVTETVSADAVEVEKTQQHVRTPLHIIGKDN